MGIVSITLAVMSDMILISAKSRRDLSIRTDFDEFVEQIRDHVDHESSCTPALQGAEFNGSVRIKDPLIPTRAIASVGDHSLIGWKISEIVMQDLIPVPAQAGLMRGSLMITGTKDQGVFLGAPTMNRKVSDLYFVVGAAGSAEEGRITKCYGAESPAHSPESLCKMLGGKWFGSNKPGAQCIVFAQKEESGSGKGSEMGS